MTAETFTTEEVSQDTTGTISVIRRYFREVPFQRMLLIPNLVWAALAAGGDQFFVWLCGKLAECTSGHECSGGDALSEFGISLSLQTLALVALVVFILRLIQWPVFEAGGQIFSMGLFTRMVGGVGRVRTTFFDEYPSGKVINRLIKDADQLRLYAPIRIGDASSALVELVIVAIVISFASPLAAIVAIPAFASFMLIQRNIAPMLQKVMMLRSIRFGEVLHRESDIIDGVRCFELYGDLNSLLTRFSQAVYRYMQMHFLRGQIEAWGRFWCDVTVAVYGCITLTAVYVGIHYGGLSAIFGVMIVTAALRLGGLFGWLTWSLGSLFETAGHARRVFEYVDLPSEETEEGLIPNQPESRSLECDGELCFVNYTMSYRDSTPAILSNFSVKIEKNSKVGLVGRTGAGKTSLVQALFRMVYVQGGDIRLGGRSLLSLPVEEARAYFSIVPQDPYLFEGTVRSNLDRYNEHDDEALLEALSTVQLSLDLAMELHEGGTNLSLGQRQLLCLARVIISKRPFVIMDEPTSGVDTITDAVMQSVLRAALADRTVITIAHRLETLARMDRVIELSEGRILRDGKPSEILPFLADDELA